MIWDTHAHYEVEKFDADRLELLSVMQEKGIGRITNVGSTMETSQKSLELAQEYAFIYAIVGVHPSEINELTPEAFKKLETMAKQKKVLAIGEIGLDYYWDKEPDVQKKQREAFQRQLDLAKKMQLPVMIHSRDAAKDTMEILKRPENQGMTGDIHCYSYKAEQALEYIRMGYYIGVGGVITFKNGRRLRETVEAVPLERILLETDCPYMSPEPFRGERNDSTRIPYMVEKIAEIKKITKEEVERVTWNNAKRLFIRAER